MKSPIRAGAASCASLGDDSSRVWVAQPRGPHWPLKGDS